MTKKTIQNKTPEVENAEITLEVGDRVLIDIIENAVATEATQRIYDAVTGLENLKHLSKNIAEEINAELLHASFLSEQLELNEKQKELLIGAVGALVDKAKTNYLFNAKKDKRLEDISHILRVNLIKILEELLSGVAKEINRGALINCVAVQADVKNDKFNKIELHTTKEAGDITIPTRCLLVSTNCYDVIKGSINKALPTKE